MKPSVIFLSLFASCLLMGQELETYSGQYILRSGEIPFVCPDGRRHEITYHYYTGADGRRIWHGECEYSDGTSTVSGNFADGLRQGQWTLRFEGSVSGECHYSDGVLDGAFFMNFTDGYDEYMASGEFDQGRLAGEMHISSDDETFIAEFDGDGKPSGVWKYIVSEDIFQTFYEFDRGFFVSESVYDDSRGETTVLNQYSSDSGNVSEKDGLGVFPAYANLFFSQLGEMMPSYRKVVFLCQEDESKSDNERDELDFQLVEVKPSFEGGDANTFSKWVTQHLRYPALAKKNGVSGRVMLEFTIMSDGRVANVRVLRGVDPLLDAEAVRVVSSSPRWKPGSIKGEAVNVTYTFPVIFQLQ